MELSVEKQGAIAIVAIFGSIDALTAGEATAFLEQQIKSGEVQLVADLGQVDYISSAGLRTILATLKEARAQGGDLRLANIQPNVRKVLQMSGFTGILKVFDTRDEAISSY